MRGWACVLLLTAGAAAQEAPDWPWWRPAARDAQRVLEERLTGAVSTERLRAYHARLAARPHRAGTEGDLAVATEIAETFRSFGLDVKEQEIFPYLAEPVAAEVEIVAPERVPLPLRERPCDDYSALAEASGGWNAYSGSGEATGEVVYANYGRKEDYERLDALGVDLKGKIVVARYGGNFRGYKARFAEDRGAAGLLIYTDPIDSGWFKGLMYPEGGWANESYIQRGSILVLPYAGDPLTPFAPATEKAERLDPKAVALPAIPVQPLGWGAATEILGRMTGAPVPEGWQGALPFTYRVTGGDALKVRVKVEQARRVTRTVNVLGTLRGAVHPEQLVIVGAHHDAWDFGAGDPLAGTILVLEAARCFAEAVRAGERPARSIVFAAWGAEEFGIIGSTEWVETHRERLATQAVAYLNLDMAAMGLDVHCAAAPVLRPVLAAACRAEGHALKKFGDLGGGSDHVAFYCHVGVPSAGLGAGGSAGTSYHSLYDNLAWYGKVVGEDYASAALLTRVVDRVLARLANADLLPLSPAAYGEDLRPHLDALEARAKELGLDVSVEKLRHGTGVLDAQARRLEAKLKAALERGLDAKTLAAINRQLLGMERDWLHPEGLPGRPWFRSLYAASDEDSGYAAWVLPALQHALEEKDPKAFATWSETCRQALLRLGARLGRIERLLQ